MPIFGASFHESDETPEELEARLASARKQIEAAVASVLKANPDLVALWAHAAGRLVGKVMVQKNLPSDWIKDVHNEMLAQLIEQIGIDRG